jgi:starvation-inducible DNA-binding protein
MKTTQFTGLNPENLQGVLNGLQQLLADYQVFYTNLRGFHWNVKGKNFYVLHEQFEKMYDDAAEKIDEIAERILMLDGIPAHNFSTYLKMSKVNETAYTTDGDACLSNIMDTLRLLVSAERDILKEASEAGDETTVAMMSDYIKEQEKALWMLTSYYS